MEDIAGFINDMQAKVDRGQPLSAEERNSLSQIQGMQSSIGGASPEGGDSKGSLSASPESTGTLSKSSRNNLGKLAGKVTETGAKVSGFDIGIPGGAGILGGGVKDIVSGQSLQQTGLNAGMRAGANVAADQLGKMGVPSYGIGPVVSTGIKAASGAPLNEVAATGTKSLLSSAGGILGSMFAGPVGAYVGSELASYFADESIADGFLGDMLDVRAYEDTRDIVESTLDDSDVGYFDRQDIGRDYAEMEAIGEVAPDQVEDMVQAGVDTEQETQDALSNIDYSDNPFGADEISEGYVNEFGYSDGGDGGDGYRSAEDAYGEGRGHGSGGGRSDPDGDAW